MGSPVARNQVNVVKAAPGVTVALRDANWKKIANPRIGLWDNAFDGSRDLINVALRNSRTDDFITDDSRCFQIELIDPAAAGRKFVEVSWRTLYASSGAALSSFSPGTLTLLPMSGGHGAFRSKPLMLVSDGADLIDQVDSGLEASDADGSRAGPRTRSQSDYRLRLSDLWASVEVGYPATNPRHVAQWFTFATYKTAKLVVYVMRQRAGGPTVVPIDDAFWMRLHAMREIYARVGVHVTTIQQSVPGSLHPTERTESKFGQTWTAYEVDPPAGVDPADLIKEHRIVAVPAAYPCSETKACRAVYATSWSDLSGKGVALTPKYLRAIGRWTGTPSGEGNAGVFYVLSGAGATTTAHELGHMVIDCGHMDHYIHRNKNEFDDALPAQTYRQNLMGMGDGLGWNGRKRIWNFASDSDDDGNRATQIDSIFRADNPYIT